MTAGDARRLALLSALVPTTAGAFFMASALVGPDHPVFLLAIVVAALVHIYSTSFALRMGWPQPWVAGELTQRRRYLREARPLVAPQTWKASQVARWLGVAAMAGGLATQILKEAFG